MFRSSWSYTRLFEYALFFALGLTAGLFLRLPLLPYVLPEGISTLLGAIIGAALAVFGAAWVSERKEYEERKSLRTSVEAILGTVTDSTRRYEDLVQVKGGAEHSMEDEREVELEAERARGRAQEALDLIEDLKPIFVARGATAMLAYQHIGNAVRRVESFCGADVAIASTPRFRGFGSPLQLGKGDHLTSARSEMGKALEMIFPK